MATLVTAAKFVLPGLLVLTGTGPGVPMGEGARVSGMGGAGELLESSGVVGVIEGLFSAAGEVMLITGAAAVEAKVLVVAVIFFDDGGVILSVEEAEVVIAEGEVNVVLVVEAEVVVGDGEVNVVMVVEAEMVVDGGTAVEAVVLAAAVTVVVAVVVVVMVVGEGSDLTVTGAGGGSIAIWAVVLVATRVGVCPGWVDGWSNAPAPLRPTLGTWGSMAPPWWGGRGLAGWVGRREADEESLRVEGSAASEVCPAALLPARGEGEWAPFVEEEFEVRLALLPAETSRIFVGPAEDEEEDEEEEAALLLSIGRLKSGAAADI